MDYTTIIVKKANGVAKITLNRPEVMNGMNRAMVTEIGDALTDAENDAATRVVIITGKGKAFCAGADLKAAAEEMGTPSRQEAWFRLANKTMINGVIQLSKPVIAAINGACLGGGYELMSACDFAVAADEAIIGEQHINFGIVGPGGGIERTVLLLGPRKAKEIILMGKRLTGKEAANIGLVNAAVPKDQLESAAHEMAVELAQKSPVALRLTKALINRALQVDFSISEQLEVLSAVVNNTSEDYAEGMKAFSEKRKPVFKGR